MASESDDLLRIGEHDVEIVHVSGDIVTRGLSRYTGAELRLTLAANDFGPDGHLLIDHVTSYVVQTGAKLRAGETYVYGFWLLKFLSLERGHLLIGEVLPGVADQFDSGASRAMRYWREQEGVCARVGALHRPPVASAVALMSPGVYDAVGVEGSRYNLGPDRSGWVLVADGWQGDEHSLHLEHLYHLVIPRPDLVRYMGLPYGCRFHVDGNGIETDLELDPEIE